MQTVAETAHYLRRAAKRLTEEERSSVIDRIAGDPECGVLIRDTGGLRKLRFAIVGRGKSGGVRIVYYVFAEHAPIFLLEVFGKNEKDNLTRAERNALAKAAAALKELYRRDK